MRLLYVLLLSVSYLSSLLSQYTLSGTVTNTAGERLSFATVFLEGTQLAAATDAKGGFQIDRIPGGTYTLKVTFIGYQAYQQVVTISDSTHLSIVLQGDIYNLDQIEIQANRVGKTSPYTFGILDKKTLQKENTGVDVPFLLQWTPSMVVTSDAGTGIGYTGMRLRGSDQTRINVTINGVPLNDAESHNVFWVDLPDLMGSVKDIQIQRGAGTSTNGPGAFGGTVAINTHDFHVNPFARLTGTLGAFGTRKISVSAGSGLINDRYTVDGRYSLIRSDGYIDRATADLSSMSFSAARLTAKSSLRLNILHGAEETYQAWYGVPMAKFRGDTSALLTHYYNNLGSIYKTPADSVNLFSSGRNYNYYLYPQQVDNYRQTHIQLIHSLTPRTGLKTKATLFYTRGKGYFEEFRSQDKLASYLLPTVTDSLGQEVTRTDIVRRRWLDNHLLGVIADADWTYSPRWQWQAGIHVNRYTGDHFGNVIRTGIPVPGWQKEAKYYDNTGQKTDASTYIRSVYYPRKGWQWQADLQMRHVRYGVEGIDNDLRVLNVGETYTFFNPKVGVSWQAGPSSLWYLSFAIAHKEPSRSDFIDNAFAILPSPEQLRNTEWGYRFRSETASVETNIFFMDYRNQLVLTGELNDVGAPIRSNVPESYRLGWEIQAAVNLTEQWTLTGTTTLTRNKIKSFNEIIADYTDGFEIITIPHENTDISFSPRWTGALQALYRPFKGWETELSSRWVSSQYLDNTSSEDRSMPAYHYQNLRLTWTPPDRWKTKGAFSFFINNLLNAGYASNGYTYTYVFGAPITENYVYPQAGRHIMCTFTMEWQ